MRAKMSTLPAYLDVSRLSEIIHFSLREDVETGDITSLATIPVHTTATAVLIAKEDGVVAGLFVAQVVMNEVDQALSITWTQKDGDFVHSGATIGTIQGNARSILLAERLALNFLQRMSGIATLTHKMVQALNGSPTKLLDTRKTAPGLRMLDKWAVLLGGGHNHRVGLFDMILIKENHIAAAGGIEKALTRAISAKNADFALKFGDKDKNRAGVTPLKIEIEVTSIDELQRVLQHGAADRVMLDNFVKLDSQGQVDTSKLERALTLVAGSIETEASGNVTLDTLGAIGKTGVDYISSGALTHSVRAMDFSLLITIDA